MNLESLKKLDRLINIINLFQAGKRRWRVKEIADKFEINEDTASKYLRELRYTGLLPITSESHEWYLPDGAITPKLELSLSYAEAGGLYLAGRLLSQTQDEQNWHISMALKKLIDALPPAVREQQGMLLEMLHVENEDEPEQQRNISNIFQVLTSGWITRHSVRLSYLAPGLREFECTFDPYLLEPSAIGRTIYAIGRTTYTNGHSNIVKDLRTFKLERIQKASLTGQTFDVPSDFNGPELLKHAWGVMYGDETPVQVHLRFSAEVTGRVRETRWHPSQNVTPTRDGCEWSACIGDTLEIEPWIRGWGGDCEVLEPPSLRERMLLHLRKSMKNYGLNGSEPAAHDPKKFDRNLFGKE